MTIRDRKISMTWISILNDHNYINIFKAEKVYYINIDTLFMYNIH